MVAGERRDLVAASGSAPVPAGSNRGTALPDDNLNPRHNPRSSDRPGKEALPDRDTGAALRSIYQKTIDEQIPDEMLDLLGKLD